ncbi:MAG: hypothetical protein RL141_260 [Candidatus Parcubacteria bacterium]
MPSAKAVRSMQKDQPRFPTAGKELGGAERTRSRRVLTHEPRQKSPEEERPVVTAIHIAFTLERLRDAANAQNAKDGDEMYEEAISEARALQGILAADPNDRVALAALRKLEQTYLPPKQRR